MIYEHSNDLSIGPYHFMVYAFAPETAERSGLISQGIFSIRYRAPQNGYRAMLLHCVEGQSLQIVVASIEDVRDGLPAVEEFFRTASSPSSWNIDTVCADLEQFARSEGLYASVSALSVSDAMQEDADFAIIRVFTAGMPPLVMIENGHYHFPVRSGIPLGINDLPVSVQPLELSTKASLYVHTPLDGHGAGLKELHSMLLHLKSEMIPEDVLLFGLHLKKAES